MPHRLPQVGTGALLGKTGNVRKPKKCKKGFKKKKGKCVKKRHNKRHSKRRGGKSHG